MVESPDVEETAEEVPLATPEIAATAATSAPIAKAKFSAAITPPPKVAKGKDSTVAFTSRPMSI